MNELPNWEADTEEASRLLSDLEARDPKGYRAGQVRVEDRGHRLGWLASLGRRRKSRGMDQTLVAAMMGTSQSAVARLEGGLSDPKMSTLQRYAQAIGYELHFSLIPRHERVPLIQESDMERAVAEAARALRASGLDKKVDHARALRIGYEGLKPGMLSVEMSPGDVTISGHVSDGDGLSTLIDKVRKYVGDDHISIDVDVEEGPTTGVPHG